MAKFRVNPEASVNGTSLAGYFVSSYRVLEAIFGESLESDEYKVSGEWIFENVETGDVYTLYDWKSTNLYASDLPSVEFFRNKKSYEFHIGSNTRSNENVKEFIKFLENKVSEYNKNLQKEVDKLIDDVLIHGLS
jgi:hypothetical protein